jgi:PhzF family phenazine biosynthesis protein
VEILRLAAFTLDPEGGNPAGVVLDADLSDAAAMQQVAADVGYSETAFCGPLRGAVVPVRYFAPQTEVPFCGHATIAAAVALADRHGAGEFRFDTHAGEVPVSTRQSDGPTVATLTSVEPEIGEISEECLDEALAALRWRHGDLHPDLPPRVAYAGADHLVIGVRSRERLSMLDYDVEVLRALMTHHGWLTVHLAWPESELVHHVRNPFPVGGVYEDPATGAAAAAYGAYLRELGAVTAPATLTLHQGADMGRPSLLTVDLVSDDPRVRVTGTAVAITASV